MDDAEQRFRDLYERHYADLYRYVARRLVDVEASDVVAEVFLVAWRRIDQLRADGALPWLYRVAGFVVANEMRGARRGRQLAARLAAEPDRSGDDDHADQIAGRLDLALAFDRLSAADQEVLRLVVWERLDSVDAAAALGCSRATFAMRLLRARRRLQAQVRTGSEREDTASVIAEPSEANRGG